MTHSDDQFEGQPVAPQESAPGFSHAAGSADDYTADQISVLEGMDAVRKRPGMYVQGGTGIDGYHQLLTEIIDNAVDEGLAGYATEVDITMHADGSATVAAGGSITRAVSCADTSLYASPAAFLEGVLGRDG